MNGPHSGVPGEPEPAQQSVALPLARPRLTYVLLALIAVVFVLESVPLGFITPDEFLLATVQYNPAVAAGQYWRLFTPLFIHFGLAHIAFNAWALYTLGQQVEAYYGLGRFALIYFLAGLAGNVAYYMSLSQAPSGGASGAIFGLVGAEIAYFLRNRRLFGRVSRQQLSNLAMLVAINLVLGFTMAGINNLAHIGGLIAGFLLGMGLAPQYAVSWDSFEPRAVNHTSALRQVFAVAVVAFLLYGGMLVGNQRWEPYVPHGRGQAYVQGVQGVAAPGYWAEPKPGGAVPG